MEQKRLMCTYCAQWNDMAKMTPMFEQDKPHVNFYCEHCLPTVKKSVAQLPYSHLFKFGTKGEMR